MSFLRHDDFQMYNYNQKVINNLYTQFITFPHSAKLFNWQIMK